MGLIFRPRQPRSFNHRPIYWDPKKEQLERRIAQIRREFEASEASTNSSPHSTTAADDAPQASTSTDQLPYTSGEEIRETLSNSLFGGTRHLKKQRERGIDNYARTGIILRCILILILLGFVVWVLYYRQGPLFTL